MKQILLTKLRDRTTPISLYRQTADQLGMILAIESSKVISKTSFSLDTPLASTQGIKFKNDVVLVPILRSGLVLLPPFLRFYQQSTVGFIGTKRDEKTAIPEHYYTKLPLLNSKHTILILDPMIATGGSASLAVKILKDAGADEKQITLVAILGAPEGVASFQKNHPQAGLLVAQIDQGLDEQKRILPGLGDFGDRYFGTE